MAVQWPLLILSVLLGIASGSFVFLGIGELTGRFRKIRFIAAVIILACLALPRRSIWDIPNVSRICWATWDRGFPRSCSWLPRWAS